MNKICGCSCEHNKSGVCQISVCDKKLIMSDKTEVQTFTRYIDTTITELQQENKVLRENAENNDRVVDKANWENKLLKKENKQLKDNWNRLREYCKENTLCYEVGDDENTKLIGSKIHGLNVLDKMQELEQGSDSNEI